MVTVLALAWSFCCCFVLDADPRLNADIILSECGRLFELQPKDVAFGFGCVHLYIIMYLDVQKINEVDGEMEWVSDLRSMAVRSRKYSPHINDDARKYMLCAKIFVHCAENL